MKKSIKLYKEFYIDRDYELVALFNVLNERFSIKHVLYPGSYVHIAPSFIFPDVTYVDSFRKAQPFFEDPAVLKYINKRKVYEQDAHVTFLLEDYQKSLPFDLETFDLLISLYAGLISPNCKKYVKPGGLVLVNNSHGDASIAALDRDLTFIGAIHHRGEKFILKEENLSEYFIPKKPEKFTEDIIRSSGKGVGFTKTAFMYLFRKESSSMQDRFYGNYPYNTVVLHGGPGAQGSMGYVAQELGKSHSILEPMQHADTVQGQINELHEAISTHANEPVTLIGWSWGAWLGWWYAAQYPQYVKRLILVSSGPFEAHYAEGIDETRLSRLTPAEQLEIKTLQAQFTDPNLKDKTTLFSRFGELCSKVDNYDPISIIAPPTELNMDIFNSVWPEGAALRKSGALLADAGKITLPVVAIHGDYDPHPWLGVKEPLSQRLTDFSFHLLPNCGHDPWLEHEAQAPFFDLLESYL